MIGGSGGVNTMLYTRGNRQDYDTWRDLGNVGWGYYDVFPYFEKSLKFVNGAGLVLNRFPYHEPFLPVLQSAIKQNGDKLIYDFSDRNNIGYAVVPTTQGDGRRISTGKSYLAAAKDRPNLKVIKSAEAVKINFDHTGTTPKACSVTFVYKGSEHSVAANKEIILSAGAIDSPKLLMRSGIGPSELLQNNGFETIANLSVALV